MKQKILDQLNAECPWGDTLYWYDTVDSTNTQAKAMAQAGAPHGTVLLSGSQTGGRGRMGRSFSSPEGMGVYLSVILRPQCPPHKLMHLTCAVAVAARRAIGRCSGVCPEIKWINDLVWQGRKLGGILTELSLNSATGLVDYAIVGIGINCCGNADYFPAELRDIVTTVEEIAKTPCSPARLAAAVIEALYEMDKILLSEKKEIMEAYRRHCITLGKEITVISGEDRRSGTALSLDEDGGLVVAFADGSAKTVNSGEVSVRGICGYL